LDRIADTWTVLIIRHLADSTLRFSRLRRSISSNSQKALMSTRRGLERDAIVHQRLYAGVPPGSSIPDGSAPLPDQACGRKIALPNPLWGSTGGLLPFGRKYG